MIHPDYRPARAILVDPRSMTLVEGQRASRGLTITIADRVGSPLMPEKVTPRLIWPRPECSCIATRSQRFSHCGAGEAKARRGPRATKRLAPVRGGFPRGGLTEAERILLEVPPTDAGQASSSSGWRSLIIVKVPGALDAEFLLGIEPRQESFKGQLAIDFGTVNTTITVYNGSVIRQLPLYEDQLERLREEFEAWFRADPACAMPGVPEGP